MQEPEQRPKGSEAERRSREGAAASLSRHLTEHHLTDEKGAGSEAGLVAWAKPRSPEDSSPREWDGQLGKGAVRCFREQSHHPRVEAELPEN